MNTGSVYVDGKDLNRKFEFADYYVTTKDTGMHTYSGVIKLSKYDGRILEYPFSSRYFVTP